MAIRSQVNRFGAKQGRAAKFVRLDVAEFAARLCYINFGGTPETGMGAEGSAHPDCD